MLQAAQRLLNSKRADLDRLLAENRGYCVRLVGHSLGAGTAALITILLKRGAGATLIFLQTTDRYNRQTDTVHSHTSDLV